LLSARFHPLVQKRLKSEFAISSKDALILKRMGEINFALETNFAVK
jgi:hypothetical protein